MNAIKQLSLSLLIILVVSTSFSSCLTTKTNVGTFKEQEGDTYTYAKSKQLWLFWGIVPLGRTNTNTPGDGNCQVITKFTFGDVLISCLTLGVVTSYTIKVKAKRQTDS